MGGSGRVGARGGAVNALLGRVNVYNSYLNATITAHVSMAAPPLLRYPDSQTNMAFHCEYINLQRFFRLAFKVLR